MNQLFRCFSTVVLTPLLFAAFETGVFAQDIDKRCREIAASTASKQRSRTYHSTVILVSDKFEFYDAVWKKVRAAATLNRIAPGLGLTIQQLDPAILDHPDIGGRPQTTNENDLLSFQSRLTKLLNEIMSEVTDFDPGEVRDRVHHKMVQQYGEQIDDLRDEYAELRCGFLKTNPDAKFPDIGGSWESNYKGSWNPTSISQSGKTLTFTNEFGDSSPGVFVSPLNVKATKWESGLGATISNDAKTIRWANGTIWRRR